LEGKQSKTSAAMQGTWLAADWEDSRLEEAPHFTHDIDYH
jgi:hypothetical protein